MLSERVGFICPGRLFAQRLDRIGHDGSMIRDDKDHPGMPDARISSAAATVGSVMRLGFASGQFTAGFFRWGSV
jgi:hypothetical protein